MSFEEVELVPVGAPQDPDEMPTQRIRFDQLEDGEALLAEIERLDAPRYPALEPMEDELDLSLEAVPAVDERAQGTPALRPILAFISGFATVALLLWALSLAGVFG